MNHPEHETYSPSYGALSFVRSNFLILTVCMIIGRFFYRRHVSPLADLPGPFLASGSRLWKFWSVLRGHTETDKVNMHKKYGPIVRLGPDEVAFASPNAAADILAVGKGYTKTDFYTCFPMIDNPDIFTEIDENKHAKLKRYSVVPYSLNSMGKMTKYVENVENELAGKLDKFADSGRTCDLTDWLHWFSFDDQLLGEVAFSVRFGFLEKECDVGGCIAGIDEIQFYDGLIGQVPPLDYLLRRNPILPHLPSWFQSPPLQIAVMAIGEVMKRKAAVEQIGSAYADDRADLLGQLLEAHAKNPDEFTEKNVIAVAFGAIGAGSDSTASTMQSFFYLVLNHPNVYSKLESEILTAEKEGKLSQMVSFSEGQALPYFQACLNEAMRIRPALGLEYQRFVPKGGATIDGKQYHGGMRASVNAWALHRDQNAWGKDADVFRPERWLEGDAKAMERNMYQFGGGRHLCIGRNLALLQMNKLLPQLIRRYHFEIVHPGRPLKHHTTFFVVQKGLEVRLRKQAQ
ncbi:cytochrome P450 oxidoreductase [Rhizodiscina lignyota]|uniref:Cytochrome P450 oxidoreductase n=1 Tax=Rhizodiscina lignyota TaxID=1504668 RepID=A0A9P4I3L0_9PEZI|nr:cytochrome P450 oxidoreductase [Rhizodiscina lignyota]